MGLYAKLRRIDPHLKVMTRRECLSVYVCVCVCLAGQIRFVSWKDNIGNGHTGKKRDENVL